VTSPTATQLADLLEEMRALFDKFEQRLARVERKQYDEYDVHERLLVVERKTKEISDMCSHTRREIAVINERLLAAHSEAVRLVDRITAIEVEFRIWTSVKEEETR
jgi:hypothetical protein